MHTRSSYSSTFILSTSSRPQPDPTTPPQNIRTLLRHSHALSRTRTEPLGSVWAGPSWYKLANFNPRFPLLKGTVITGAASQSKKAYSNTTHHIQVDPRSCLLFSFCSGSRSARRLLDTYRPKLILTYRHDGIYVPGQLGSPAVLRFG